MGMEEAFAEAKSLYRDAQLELKGWRGPITDEAQFYMDELEEALLDLKQAVIDLRAEDVVKYFLELRALREE